MYSIAVNNIYKSYSKIRVLNGLSFDFKSGEIVGLLGANGSGKTTLMKCICGMSSIDKGEVVFKKENHAISKDSIKIGVLIDTKFLDYLTNYDNLYVLGLYSGMSKSSIKSEIEKLLEIVRLDNKKYNHPYELSFGQLQKLAVVQAFLGESDFLILDEPTVGLDIQSVDILAKEIKKRASYGEGILVSSHDYAFLERVCTKIIIINGGEVIYNGILPYEDEIIIKDFGDRASTILSCLENMQIEDFSSNNFNFIKRPDLETFFAKRIKDNDRINKM